MEVGWWGGGVTQGAGGSEFAITTNPHNESGSKWTYRSPCENPESKQHSAESGFGYESMSLCWFWTEFDRPFPKPPPLYPIQDANSKEGVNNNVTKDRLQRILDLTHSVD